MFSEKFPTIAVLVCADGFPFSRLKEKTGQSKKGDVSGIEAGPIRNPRFLRE